MKLITRSLAFAALLIAFVGLSFGQTAPRTWNAAEHAAHVTEFDVNGLKVLVKRRPAAPTVAAGLFFRGGARNINEKNAGIENLTLNAALEAGKNVSRQQARRQLSAAGSTIGAGSAKDYSVVSLAATRANFDRTWDIFTDLVINPAFVPGDVERVRQQMIAGLREQETSPDGALNSLQDRILFAGHPYGISVVGTTATVAALTPKDLAAYHASLLQTSRMLLVVVGDIDPNELKAKITQSFGKLPRGSYQEKPLPAIDFSKPTIDIAQRTIQTNYVQGAFNAPSLSNPDYFAMRVAITILQQLVYEEVRIRRQLSYAPNAELNNLAANTASIYVTAVDANQAVKVMLDQIDQLKTDTIRSEIIEGMAGQFLTNYYINQETNAAQVIELARYELIGGGWRNSFDFLDRMEKVTPEAVRNVARKYMTNIRFAVIGDPNAVDRDIFIRASVVPFR